MYSMLLSVINTLILSNEVRLVVYFNTIDVQLIQTHFHHETGRTSPMSSYLDLPMCEFAFISPAEIYWLFSIHPAYSGLLNVTQLEALMDSIAQSDGHYPASHFDSKHSTTSEKWRCLSQSGRTWARSQVSYITKSMFFLSSLVQVFIPCKEIKSRRIKKLASIWKS